MKNKSSTILIILSVLIVIGGMVLNFNEFLMGSPATIKNVIVTCAYILFWILILIIGIKNKDSGVMKYCSIFWMLTLLTALITGYVNVTDANIDFVIIFVILLLGQWYGIKFIVGSFLTASIIIAVISLIMFIISDTYYTHCDTII
ncbi:MAG: hypothetical protein ACK4M9_20795 [Anaerobacillus sp.]|uniref:hypothetical protein n=1 Tax=Anaerobacillus sp. TaxID=1872506 RepID=UPI003919A587